MVLVVWRLWPAPVYGPPVRLPPGVSLAEVLREGKRERPLGWHTNIYCQGTRPTITMDVGDRARLFLERTRYAIHELLGQSLVRMPSPPIVDYLTPRLGECFDTSGEKYLLAKEFMWEVGTRPERGSDFTFLGFVWGGTNQLRHARDRIPLIEDGIVRNGVFGLHLSWSLPERRGVTTIDNLQTNRCAVIRDTQGLVKIVPLDYLKTYVEAGLVTLPNTPPFRLP